MWHQVSASGFVDGGKGGGGFKEQDHPRDQKGEFTGNGKGKDKHAGKSGSVHPAPAQDKPTPSQKSVLAKQTSRRVAADVQRYSEEHCEPILARGLKRPGINTMNLRDNEPMDVVRVRAGKIEDGVELKVMTENKNSKLTMKGSALKKKQAWMQENQADGHTVVFDDQKIFNAKGDGKHGDDQDRAIYYRRGFGSFRVTGANGGMYRCRDMNELHQMMDLPAKALPPAAQPPKGYSGYK